MHDATLFDYIQFAQRLRSALALSNCFAGASSRLDLLDNGAELGFFWTNKGLTFCYWIGYEDDAFAALQLMSLVAAIEAMPHNAVSILNSYMLDGSFLPSPSDSLIELAQPFLGLAMRNEERTVLRGCSLLDPSSLIDQIIYQNDATQAA